MWGAFFGQARQPELVRLQRKNTELRQHVEVLVSEQERTTAKHSEEKAELAAELAGLRARLDKNMQTARAREEEFETRLRAEANARLEAENAVQQAKKKLEETERLLHTQTDTWKEKDREYRIRLDEAQIRLAKWTTLSPSPEALQEKLQSAEKRAIFCETGTADEDICKLYAILRTKIEERNVAECGSEQGKPEGKRCEGKNDVLGEECPFKARSAALQSQLEECKAKVELLEKKEKLLNKMLNATVRRISECVCSSSARAVHTRS